MLKRPKIGSKDLTWGINATTLQHGSLKISPDIVLEDSLISKIL